MKKDISAFKRWVRAYQRKELSGETRDFEFAGPYNLIKDWPHKEIPYPHCDRPGVYAIFNEKKEVLYIGKASNSSSIGGRLSSYFRNKKSNPRICELKHHPDSWHGTPRFIMAAAVHKSYQAPSLEEYLIRKMDPPANVIGLKRKRG